MLDKMDNLTLQKQQQQQPHSQPHYLRDQVDGREPPSRYISMCGSDASDDKEDDGIASSHQSSPMGASENESTSSSASSTLSTSSQNLVCETSEINDSRVIVNSLTSDYVAKTSERDAAALVERAIHWCLVNGEFLFLLLLLVLLFNLNTDTNTTCFDSFVRI